MKPVLTIEEFFKINHNELKKCIRHISKSTDEEFIDDMSQNFYLRLTRFNSLVKYDPNGGASFSTYIWTVIEWVIKEESLNKKVKFNDRALYKENVVMNSKRGSDRTMDIEEEIWSKIGEFDGKLRVDPAIKDSFATVEKSKQILNNLESFKKYLMGLKEKDKKKDRMIKYIELVDFGLNGTNIAEKFGVSDTMVKDIKKNIQKHYRRWNKAINNKLTYAL